MPHVNMFTNNFAYIARNICILSNNAIDFAPNNHFIVAVAACATRCASINWRPIGIKFY